jgi:hypothetical protein
MIYVLTSSLGASIVYFINSLFQIRFSLLTFNLNPNPHPKS